MGSGSQPRRSCPSLSWDLRSSPPNCSHFAGHVLVQTVAWRQGTTNVAVQHAVQLQAEDRYLFLGGDPAAAVEAAAVPSGAALEGLAACLLDAAPVAQAARLAARGDGPADLPRHQAFADWMRKQANDPLYRLDVVTTDNWPQMQWGRLPDLAPQWHVQVAGYDRSCPATVAVDVSEAGSAICWRGPRPISGPGSPSADSTESRQNRREQQQRQRSLVQSP